MVHPTENNRSLKANLFLTLSLLLIAVLVMTGCGAGDTNDTVVEETPVAGESDTIVAEETPVVGVAPTEAVTEPEAAAQPTEAAAESETVATDELSIQVSELMGYNVVNPQGENLGEIEDVIVGLDSEQIKYAVLSFGGFLDIGDKLFAIPLSAMTFNSAEERFVFDMAEDQLQNAPSFDDNTWPDLIDPQWDTNIRDFWQDERLATTTDQAQEAAMVTEGTFIDEAAVRASELLDYNIRNSQGEEVGEVDDLIIGLNTGHVNYAVLSFGGFADIGDKLYAVPLSALNFDTINQDEQAFIIDVDEAALQNAPSFDQNNWPDLTTPGWDAEFSDYWDQTTLGAVAPITAEMAPTALDEAAVRASELIGYNVVNSQGEDVGEVEDLLVNLTNGQVHYAILSFGGFADIGDKLFAIPLSTISFNSEDQAVVFDSDEQMLQNAPSFDENTWPDMTSPEWDTDIRDYWQNQGVTVADEANLVDETAVVDRSAMRASELIGYNVVNAAGEDLGEIEDLMLGLDSQQVNYAVLSFGGFLDIGEKLFAIPVTALRLDTAQEAVVFDVDEATLENAPGFDPNNWPDTANPQWDLDARDYWQNR